MVELDSCLAILIGLLLITTCHVTEVASKAEAERMIKHLDDLHSGLSQFSRSVRSTNRDLSNLIRFTLECHLGLNSPSCYLGQMDHTTQEEERLRDTYNPGKRSITSLQDVSRKRRSTTDCPEGVGMNDPGCMTRVIDHVRTLRDDLLSRVTDVGKRSEESEDVSRTKRLLEDLKRKQGLLKKLSDTLSEVQDTLITERKRSCNLNLGFHCQTEQYSAIADMYNWLQSSLSPGKKKRDAAQGIKGRLIAENL